MSARRIIWTCTLTVVVVSQHCAPLPTLHWLTLVAVGEAVTVTVVVGVSQA